MTATPKSLDNQPPQYKTPLIAFVVQFTDVLRYKFMGTPGSWTVSKQEWRKPLPQKGKTKQKNPDHYEWYGKHFFRMGGTSYHSNLEAALHHVVWDMGQVQRTTELKEIIELEKEILRAINPIADEIDKYFLEVRGYDPDTGKPVKPTKVPPMEKKHQTQGQTS